MPKVTEAHLETRRQQVMDAAFRCFARKGFHSTTMQDICAEAQMSPGAVYRYFSSKEEMIEASCRVAEEDVSYLAHPLDERDFSALLERMAEHFFGQLDGPAGDIATRALVQVWAEAVVNDRVRLINAENMEQVRSLLRTLVERAQGSGDMAEGLDPEAMARVMVAIYQGFQLQKALDPAIDTQRYVQAALALLTGDAAAVRTTRESR